jgi:hypothetical protein
MRAAAYGSHATFLEGCGEYIEAAQYHHNAESEYHRVIEAGGIAPTVQRSLTILMDDHRARRRYCLLQSCTAAVTALAAASLDDADNAREAPTAVVNDSAHIVDDVGVSVTDARTTCIAELKIAGTAVYDDFFGNVGVVGISSHAAPKEESMSRALTHVMNECPGSAVSHDAEVYRLLDTIQRLSNENAALLEVGMRGNVAM